MTLNNVDTRSGVNDSDNVPPDYRRNLMSPHHKINNGEFAFDYNILTLDGYVFILAIELCYRKKRLVPVATDILHNSYSVVFLEELSTVCFVRIVRT